MLVNTTNETDTTEENGVKEQHSGNTRLPFGLCKKYHIGLPDNATPRDAWNALRSGVGLTPEKVYAELKGKDNVKQDSSEKRAQEENKNEERIDVEEQAERMLSSNRIYDSKSMGRKKIVEQLQYGEENSRGVTAKLFNDDSFAYRDNERDTAYFSGFNKVCLKKKAIDDQDHYERGETFYHETWHAIDYNYGAQVQQGAFGTEKVQPLSVTYKFDDGKTFKDIVDEEIKNIDFEDVKSEIKKEVKDYWATKGLDYDKVNKDFDNAIAKITALRQAGKIDEAISYRDSEEFKKIKEDHSQVANKGYPPEITKKWSNLSDMYSSTKGNSISRTLVGMGHTASYWRNSSNARAIEMFAECASAKAVNPKSYETLKKYCPETVKRFDVIFEKLKKGDIKSSGRREYQP